MENKFPQRKHPRLKGFGYNVNGAYFITICVQDKKQLLSRVGRGLAPAGEQALELTEYGKIAEEELLRLQERYPCVAVDQYVIMPNHIHIIFLYDEDAMEKDPRPTIMDVVCGFKSITTKRCKEILPIRKLFQTSFHDHVIRNREDYEKIRKYIYENPMKWEADCFYRADE